VPAFHRREPELIASNRADGLAGAADVGALAVPAIAVASGHGRQPIRHQAGARIRAGRVDQMLRPGRRRPPAAGSAPGLSQFTCSYLWFEVHAAGSGMDI